MKTKILIAIIVVVLIVVVVVRKDGISSDVIKIGSVAALTGTGNSIGIEERNGALLAIEEANRSGKKKFELVEEDLGFDNLKLSGAIASKLINVDKVVAIVGPQWDEPVQALAPNAEVAKVPMITADGTNNVEKDHNYEYLFSTWYDNRSGIKALLAHAQKQGLKNISIIRPLDGSFWKFTADLVLEYSGQYGITIIDDIKLNDPFTTDYRTTLAKIKTKKPDAIFIVVTDPTQCPFMKQVKELGITVPILGTEATGSYGSLNTCSDLLENLYFSTPKHTEGYLTFEKVYEARFGRKPQYPSAVTAYDATKIIVNAILETKSTDGVVLKKKYLRQKNSLVLHCLRFHLMRRDM